MIKKLIIAFLFVLSGATIYEFFIYGKHLFILPLAIFTLVYVYINYIIPDMTQMIKNSNIYTFLPENIKKILYETPTK